MKHIILQAHHDDAVLSVGGRIFKHNTEDHQLRLWTFTSPAEESEGTRRLAEEVDALQSLESHDHNIEYRVSPLPETPQPVIHRPLSPDRFTAAWAYTQPWFESIEPGDKIWIPLAVGGHSDHILVHALGLKWLSVSQPTCSIDILFYEDLPYAVDGYMSLTARLAQLRRAGILLMPEYRSMKGKAIAAKQQAIAKYVSQNAARWWPVIDRYSQYCGAENSERPAGRVERLWRMPPDNKGRSIRFDLNAIEGGTLRSKDMRWV